jgi:hypothetical protein
MPLPEETAGGKTKERRRERGIVHGENFATATHRHRPKTFDIFLAVKAKRIAGTPGNGKETAHAIDNFSPVFAVFRTVLTQSWRR